MGARWTLPVVHVHHDLGLGLGGSDFLRRGWLAFAKAEKGHGRGFFGRNMGLCRESLEGVAQSWDVSFLNARAALTVLTRVKSGGR